MSRAEPAVQMPFDHSGPSADGFMPHGMCYLWQPGVLWLHVAADTLIALSYLSIPFTLLYFVRKRKDLEFHWMFICFAMFIVACGLTHVLEIVVIWRPIYWISGGVKAVTALASVPTAILLVKLLPQALKLQSPAALQKANAQLAAATRQTQELAEAALAATRAKSEFLANMSHEIRTPMNGVVGMTELLLETELSSMQRDYTETVRDSAAALLIVINDILDFSKVEAGKVELERVNFDLREVIEDVARLLAVEAHSKGLEVTANVDPAIPDLLNGDPGRLRQILLNLCANAVKFTQRGEVAIEFSVVDNTPPATLLKCSVRDTGPGIPAHLLDALFQPFSQIDSSTTRRFGGTGLGLSIVRRLAQLMGGDAGVESETGVGSKFWFTARLETVSADARPRRAPSPMLDGEPVLVVDDNATNRKVLAEQLSRCGAQPTCVNSSPEALIALNQACDRGRPFTVALIDHHMPDGDGAQLGLSINADSRLRSTRLVLLTSCGHRGDGKHYAKLGFAGYLLKPVTQRDLGDCLRLVLARSADDDCNTRSQPIVTGQHLRARRGRGKWQLLLAEDNAVNQKVAGLTLEKLGYRVDIVNDGHAALQAWETRRYDLILMDCQMPGMDGYDVAREIRRREIVGTRHIPIVALTAHAMQGADLESRAAGMDDHLSKPIDRDRLEACLERWLVPNMDGIARTERVPITDPVQRPPVDLSALRILVDGDEAFARDLIRTFVATSSESLREIFDALDARDAIRVRQHAHALKGASAHVYAAAASRAAERMEMAAGVRLEEPLTELKETLQREVNRAIEYLQEKAG